jgi:myo-inositol-1-phosphate synthase
MSKIKVALVGVGNCASSLVQGRYFYAGRKAPEGLMHERLGGYALSDIQFVAAFDTDARKVGLDLGEAIFAKPNCTHVFQGEIPHTGVTVRMGKILDGMADHMENYGERGFVRSDAPEASEDDIVQVLKETGAEILVNYLPVGSEEATRFYMECALKAGVAVVNCMPVFIASNPGWEKRFRDKNLPIVGDDIKAQLGATIVHRVLSSLFRARGVQMTRTYQLNTGGNTDFMNMLDRNRLASKKESKTEAVQSALVERLGEEDIHIGPSDYIPWLNDNKLCFLRAEGNLFGEVPMNLELRLSVEDSPNSAAVVVDAIRCCKVALDRGIGGVLTGPSAFFCKHPPQQFSDDVAHQLTEEFIAGEALAAE